MPCTNAGALVSKCTQKKLQLPPEALSSNKPVVKQKDLTPQVCPSLLNRSQGQTFPGDNTALGLSPLSWRGKGFEGDASHIGSWV